MIGLGQGAAGTLPAMAAMPEIDLMAGADLNPTMRDGFAKHYPDARVYASVTKLCRDSEIEAVWVATPNRFHADNAIEAMRAGKHVIVEKPMAITMEEADRMVDTSRENGVTLLAGHTRSLSIWNRAMRRIALSGQIGPLRAIHIAAHTDWMIRPRTPDELDPEQGGGIVFRQGPHQIDTLRLLGGGMLRSVRGMTGKWMDARPIPGYFTAYLEFEDGTPATIMHNGYGYYAMASNYPWVKEKREYSYADRSALRHELMNGTRDESKEKERFRVGGSNDPVSAAAKSTETHYPWKPFDLGPVEVACERGMMLPAQWGLTVYGDDGPRDIDLRYLQRPEPDPSGGLSISILEELHGAVLGGKRAYHTAEWGRATLEASLAVMQSARERREIMLTRQVEMPVDYDADMQIDVG